MSVVLLRSSPPRDALDATCRSVARRFGRLLSSGAALFLRSDDAACLLRVAVEEAPDGAFSLERAFGQPIPVDHPALAAALEHGGTVVAGALAPSLEDTAAVVVPLRRGLELIGMIACVRARAQLKFLEQDVALMRRFAPGATEEIATAHAGRTNSVVVPARVMRFQSLSAALSEAVSMDDVAFTVLELGLPALGASGGAVVNREPGADVAEVISAAGVPREIAVDGASIDLRGNHPIACALREPDALFLGSRDAIARAFRQLPQGVVDEISACAILPLHADDRVIGALYLTMAAGGNLDGEARGLLRMLARQTARALQRVRTREAERRALMRLEHLARVTERFAQSVDLDTTLNNVVESFVPSLAEACAVEFLDHTGAVRTARANVPERAPTLSVPLHARGHELGRLDLWLEATPTHREDNILIDDLCRRAALAIDAARLLNEREDAIRVREDFLTVAGHELRTPLTTLRMWLFAHEKFGSNAPVDSAAAMRQLKRIERLVNGLLDVSRLREGELGLEREPTELTELARETAAMFEEEVLVEGPTIVGHWDRFRLGQVFTNLIANAVKFSNGQPVKVTVEGEADRARFRVRDRGIGIALEEQARIFGRFERAVSPRNYSGLGLGLWISQRIVEAHSGTISVRSEPGEGAEFIVELPRPTETNVA